MHDLTLRMMKDAGGNMLRWGHCAGPPVGAHSADKYGFATNAISEWWTLFGSKSEHSGGAN